MEVAVDGTWIGDAVGSIQPRSGWLRVAPGVTVGMGPGVGVPDASVGTGVGAAGSCVGTGVACRAYELAGNAVVAAQGPGVAVGTACGGRSRRSIFCSALLLGSSNAESLWVSPRFTRHSTWGNPRPGPNIKAVTIIAMAAGK